MVLSPSFSDLTSPSHRTTDRQEESRQRNTKPLPMSTTSKHRAPEHLNVAGCRIAYTEGKGRGVFASRSIPAQTVVEISPVLLFNRDEYESYGKHTVLDHYTFKWPDGRMALALGLGSLFNHSDRPNVSFNLDTVSESIRYTTSRAVPPDEELCIFYGHNLWFDPVGVNPADHAVEAELEDGWGGLSHVRDDTEGADTSPRWELVEGNPQDIIPEDLLPFVRTKVTPDDPEEEEMHAVQTVEAWVVDIPEQRQIAAMLKWLRTSGLGDDSASHLKRIRKSQSNKTNSLLLTLISASPEPPTLPDDINLPAPYLVTVPKLPALTHTSLKLKSTLWPTIYAPRRKNEVESWSRGKLEWAWEAMRTVVAEAKIVKANGEHPLVAYVSEPFEEEIKEATQLTRSFLSHDSRKSTCHPLRHAALNAIRAIADYRSKETQDGDPPVAGLAGAQESEERRNGSHYLLTSLTVFLSHEPCVMCSMALLHSRVKEIVYLIPMERTGGCGSMTCVPKLEGVNHRYGVMRWRHGVGGILADGLEFDEREDA